MKLRNLSNETQDIDGDNFEADEAIDEQFESEPVITSTFALKNRVTETTTAVTSVHPSALISVNANTSANCAPTSYPQAEQIQWISTSTLVPHNRNAEIYGDEPVDEDLRKSILLQGVLEPLIAKADYTLVAGHRRLKAAKMAKLPKVPVIIRDFSSDSALLVALLDSNRQRVKSREALGREVKLAMEIESTLAKVRQKDGGARKDALSAKKQTTDVQKGSARDKAGEKFGMSGPTAQHLVEIVNAIDALQAKGQIEAANAVRKALNDGSVNAGYKAAKDQGGIVIDKPRKGPKKAKSVKEKPAPVLAAMIQAAEANTVNPSAIATHADAIKAMDQLIAHVEDLKPEDMTEGKRTEWREMMVSLTAALTDAGILDL